MHEMSIAESILDIVEDEARKADSAQVTRIVLEIGQLSCVETEALSFCMDAVCRGTVAEGADVQIISIPGLARCGECQTEFEYTQRFTPCPGCGSYLVTVTGGEEMRIKELEVA
ncbi:MAG: hydrogenase maturation nickel metallochaperone HypA [Gammaproteobacteria bacterium]|nr:MAG: hydrogenase maturation nickel metallochaperone HypA [Gammaproteobacteria bacterium]